MGSNEFHCKGCREVVMRWERETHFAKHKNDKAMLIEANRVAATLAAANDTGDTRIDICTNCGETFEQERRRGRPRKQCFDCLPLKGE